MKEEMCEVVDDDLNVLRLVTRKQIVAQNLKHKVVKVIVMNNKGDFYLSQRAARKKLYALMWECSVAGAVRAGESFEDAAKRELLEELGIAAEPRYLFDSDYASGETDNKGKVFLVTYEGPVKPDPAECATGTWVSPKMVGKFELTPDAKLVLEKFFRLKFAPKHF